MDAENEALEVTQNEYFCKSDGHKYYCCPDCCELVEPYDNYCRHCGKKLKWSVGNVYEHL